MKVFIVEDDPIIVEGLDIALSQEKYEVDSFGCMKDALEVIAKEEGEVHYDVCLLDVNLPDGDGYQICKAIRAKSDVPIIFLTACDDEIHTVLALEQGADDYIAKPFRIRELIARIKAVLRRSGRNINVDVANVTGGSGEISGASGVSGIAGITGTVDGAPGALENRVTGAAGSTEGQEISETQGSSGVTGSIDPTTTNIDKIIIGKNELNIQTGKVMREGEEIFLSAVEYRLLLIFARNRGRLLTRQQILNDMWDSAGDFVNDNTLTVYVRRLRKKLEQEGDAPVIQTVRGIGYRMD